MLKSDRIVIPINASILTRMARLSRVKIDPISTSVRVNLDASASGKLARVEAIHGRRGKW